MAEQVKLNLSRKWRSSNFEGIVGQDLTLKMLKNSLYTGHYFPVYLFAGQRGCGKTTTARVFAAALNCGALSTFQGKPRSTAVPCGVCDSCRAMAAGKHPDFIEIDAASNTGVDNIRNIIEAATLLPVMGHKKIYLIDEAHMLSKAAFNALLKILEEPPRSTLFILATTDQEKIIDTVRSRCFRLLFSAISSEILVQLLKDVCQAENIEYAMDGLEYIAAHAQGSARDALNTLEQVRFAVGGVYKDMLLQALGHVDDICLLTLLQKTYEGNVQELLTLWHECHLDTVAADFVWHHMLILCRALVWLRHGVQPPDMHSIIDQLTHVSQQISLSFLTTIMEALYRVEQWFVRTTQPQGLLEMVFVQVCSQQRHQGSEPKVMSPHDSFADICRTQISQNSSEQKKYDENIGSNVQKNSNSTRSWQVVLERLTDKDPHLYSILSHGSVREFCEKENRLIIEFSAHLSFFSDILKANHTIWMPVVRAIYGEAVVIETIFDENSSNTTATDVRKSEGQINVRDTLVSAPGIKSMQSATTPARAGGRLSRDARERAIDVSDRIRWPRVNAVLDIFPGTVTIVKEIK